MKLTPERWARAQTLFHRLVDASPGERTALLDAVCGGDDELRDAVRRLLVADAASGSIVDGDVDAVAEQIAHDEARGRFTAAEFGPYRIVRLLGEGGMGMVFLAHRSDLDQVAAIKVLRDVWVSPAGRARFASEQRTLARLAHPSIARVYHADTLADGTPWFAMEYVEGVTLTEYCARPGKSLAERLRLFRDVCEAVQYAHQHLIVHRDLKPSNILVTDDGRVKLLDFGISAQLDSVDLPAGTRTVSRFVTPNYAAPEQLSGGPSGIAGDVYSLGVLLYELLAEQRPFELGGLSLHAAERLLAQREPPRPSALALARSSGTTIGRASWDDLDVLCLTAMHKDPSRRYRSVEALVRDLDHYRKGEPLEARPDSLRYRAGKFVRRNARPLEAAALGVSVVVSLATFYTWRLAAARREAMAAAARAERIQEFMQKLFDAGESEAAPAADLRVITLLDRGVREAHALEAEPIVRAALYHTLGGLYQRLGQLDRAQEILETALDERRRLLGPEHPDTLESLVALGLLRVDQARLDDAERLVREAIDCGTRSLPAGHLLTARATAALGKVLEERGSYGDAVAAFERAVEIYTVAGKEAELAATLTALANAHFYAGRLDDAEALNRRVLEMDRRLQGHGHPTVADDLLNLGAIASTKERYAEATDCYREALDILVAWYGDDHPQTASAQSILAQGLTYQGRYEEAATLLQRALATQQRVHGPVHRRVGFVLNEIGMLALRRNQLDEAERALTRSLEINRHLYAGRHFRVAVALSNLGAVFLTAGQHGPAEQLLREALDVYAETLPATHTNTAIAHVRLGRVLAVQKRLAEGERHLLEGYRILSGQTNPPATWITGARADLAELYDALGQPDRAQQFRTATPPPPVDARGGRSAED